MDAYIIGNGGFAKELWQIISEYSQYNVQGFVDLDPNETSTKVGGEIVKVYEQATFINDFFGKELALFIGLGDPKVISVVTTKFKDFYFPNFIHPNSDVIRNHVKLGQGNIVTSGCVFTVDIDVGSYNIFNLNTTIGHDVSIGNSNVFNPGSNISGSVTIGNSNLFGTNCSILQEKKIGSGSTIGASCVITKDYGNDLTIVGVPGKVLQR